MSGPVVVATVTVKDIQIMLAHHLSAAIGPWADSIERQTKAALEKIDIEAEIARTAEREVYSALRKKVLDMVGEVIESSDFAEQAQQVVATKVREGLERRVEEEVRNRIDGYVRRKVVELFNGDIETLVDRQMAKYKGQKSKRPWWKIFGRG